MVRNFGLSAPKLLVSVDQDGSFCLVPEAFDLLPDRDVPIKVIAVCGLYRTGKSFLLNLLAEQHCVEGQFKVGDTTNACTLGIHMWVAVDDMACYVLLDCEGSGNLNGDRTRDARLFALAVLFSSVFVFNSRGALDENSIQTLSLVTELAWEIQKRAGKELPPPTFFWLLRDVFLKLEDVNGNPLTTDQYLSQCLEEEANRSSTAIGARNKLCQLFSERHLHTLMQPCVDENDLQSLSRLPVESLRPEFLAQVDRLRKKIFAIPPKCGIKGGNRYLIPQQWRSFIEACVEAMNCSEVPVIVDLWTSVSNKENSRAVDMARTMFDRKVKAVEASSSIIFETQLRNAKADALAHFRSCAIGDAFQEYESELEEEIDRKIHALSTAREQTCIKEEQDKLEKMWERDVLEPLHDATRIGQAFNVDEVASGVRAKFFRQCAVRNAEEVYGEYLALRLKEAHALADAKQAKFRASAVDREPDPLSGRDVWDTPKIDVDNLMASIRLERLDPDVKEANGRISENIPEDEKRPEKAKCSCVVQ